MKIKLDENLPLQIAARLASLGHDVHTVFDEDLVGGQDARIWTVVQQEECFLITQDLDFADVRRFAPETHHGILLVRLHSPSRTNLVNRIQELFRDEEVTSWQRCFVVATERKVRIRRK